MVWTGKERQFVRDHWKLRGWTASKIANSLGRPIGQVYAAAVRFGCTSRRKRIALSHYAKRIITLHADGMSCHDIAARLRLTHQTVSKWLGKIGLQPYLKPGEHGQEGREKLRKLFLRTANRLGLDNLVQLRHERCRLEAAKRGWPYELNTLRELQVVELLFGNGPMTRNVLANRIGLKPVSIRPLLARLACRNIITMTRRPLVGGGSIVLYELAADIQWRGKNLD